MPQDPRTIPNFYGKIVPTGIQHRDTGIQTGVILNAQGKYNIDLTNDMLNLAPEDTPFLNILMAFGAKDGGLASESTDTPVWNWTDEYEGQLWIDLGLDEWRRRSVENAATPTVGSSFEAARQVGVAPEQMDHSLATNTSPLPLSNANQVGGHLIINCSKLFNNAAEALDITTDTAQDAENAARYQMSTTVNDHDPFMDDFDATNGEDIADLFSHNDCYNLFPIDNQGHIVLLFRSRNTMQGTGRTLGEKLRNRALVFGADETTDDALGTRVLDMPSTLQHQMYLAIEHATLRISPLADAGGLAVDNNYDLSTIVPITQVVARIMRIYLAPTEGCVGIKISLAPADSNIDLAELGVDVNPAGAAAGMPGQPRGLVSDADALGYVIRTLEDGDDHLVGRFGFRADNNANSTLGVHAAIHLSHGYNILNADGVAAAWAAGLSTDHTGHLSRCALVQTGNNPSQGIPEFDRLDPGENLIFHRETNYNFTQIFASKKYGISGTAMATKYKFEGDFEKTRSHHLAWYKKNKDSTYLNGIGYETIAVSNDRAVAGQPVRATSGLFDYAKFPIRYFSMAWPSLANMAATDAIAGLALARFMEQLADYCTAFRSREASKNLTFLVGRDIYRDLARMNAYYASAWNASGNLLGGNVQVNQPGQMSFGLEVYSYKVGNVTLNFVHNPSFDITPNIPIPAWIWGVNGVNPRKMMLLIDPPNMKEKVLRPDRIIGNIQDNDQDGFLEGIRGESGFQARYPKNFAVIRLT